MKTLLITAIITAAIGFHFTSHAQENVFGAQVPVEQKDVKENIKGDYVPLDFLDTFTIRQSVKPGYSEEIRSQDDRDYFYALGVPFNFIDSI